MKLYIAGPMSGLPEHNYPAFNEAERHLVQLGYRVLSPARHGIIPGWNWVDYMRAGITDLATADGIATLPGWQKSRGASLEVHIALRLGLPVRPVHEWRCAR